MPSQMDDLYRSLTSGTVATRVTSVSNLFCEYLKVFTLQCSKYSYLKVFSEIPSESQFGWIQGFSAKTPDVLGNQVIKKSWSHQ